MKKITILLLIISLIFNIVLVYFFVLKGDVVKTKDSRTSINITPENREFVLAEMRGFLESIRDINQGILDNNPKNIIAAGEKSGTGIVHEAPAGLMKTLPLSFKSLGLGTHAKFDEIAKMARENYKQQEAQKQVTSILNNCTSCHASFKFQTIPEK
ncbi:hypothetical protein [Halpernia sp.]|uniref:hypothetical protein n=1 Tax=Halpernia sp. TaxID=2782209 RepID=UPI003A8DD435